MIFTLGERSKVRSGLIPVAQIVGSLLRWERSQSGYGITTLSLRGSSVQGVVKLNLIIIKNERRLRMKTYRLANAEKLLKEIRTFIDDQMGWITEGEKQDPNLFIFSNEMRVVRDKIQKYLRGI